MSDTTADFEQTTRRSVALLQLVSSGLSTLDRHFRSPAARQQLFYVVGRAQICAQLGLHLLGPASDIPDPPDSDLNLTDLLGSLVAAHQELAERLPNRAEVGACRFVVALGSVCHGLARHV